MGKVVAGRRPECDYCYKLADAQVFARWSGWEELTKHACQDHLAMGYRTMLRRLVDGQPAQDIWHTWFDAPGYGQRPLC